MKYVYIFSDTHGMIDGCGEVLRNAERVDAIIHAGDYTDDADKIRARFPNIPVHMVKGNGDFLSREAQDLTVLIDGVKIFITHGHMYRVKSEYRTLSCRGKEVSADLVVFGHTHIPTIEYEGDMIMVNPGSSGYAGKYAVAKIENGKVSAMLFSM